MDIKPIQPGQINWNRAGETEKAAKRPAEPAADPILSQPPTSGSMQAIQSEYKRADLSTDRWNVILNRSIDALLDSASERMGGLPGNARSKISEMLAADPIFSKRVFVYWDKNLN